MKTFDIVTALDICVDLMMNLGNTEPEFGQKEKLVDGYFLELGGSACIFASQAARLGLKVAGVGKIGTDDFGQIAINRLRSSGVCCDHIQLDSHIQTGLGIALCKHNDRAILTYPGSLDAVEGAHLDRELLQNTRHLHIASYYLMKKLQPGYLEIMRAAKEGGATISLDTNWDPDEKWDGGIREVLRLVDIFLPNENEAMAFSQTTTPGDALKTLSQTVPVVVIKRGEFGAIAAKGNETFDAAVTGRMSVYDTVGAGDNFDAGFVYGFLNGYDIQTSLGIGNFCGSISTCMPGGIMGQPGITSIVEMLNH